MATKDNTLGMLSWLLGIFTGFIGPLVIYLTMSEKSGSSYENAKSALNFQLSILLYYVISMVLIIVIIGLFLIWAVGLFSLIVSIIGTIKANNAEVYSAPLTIKFIK